MLALSIDNIFALFSTWLGRDAVFVAMWGGIAWVSKNQADARDRANRDRKREEYERTERDYQTRVGLMSRQINENYESQIRQLDRQIVRLNAILSRLRLLLRDSMTHSNDLEQWGAVLESAIVGGTPKDVMTKKPSLGRRPTADDVASIFAEHGDLEADEQ